MESNQGSNSVLFALGELRDIEDDRVRTQQEREAELEAERRRLKKEREEMDRQREEQRRFELELAERRASIEAQMKLEERRIALELERIPTPSLKEPSRPKWPWLMSIAVFGLAGLQFLMWQMQKDLDKSLDELRVSRQSIRTVFIDRTEEPTPTPPRPTVAPTVQPTPQPAAPKQPGTKKQPDPPPKDPGIDCDNFEDPLGCMPKS